MKKRVFFWAVVFLVPVSVWATAGPMERAGRHEPPQEALDACKEKSEGTSAEIVTPRGDTIKATCKLMKGQLVAVPEKDFPGSGSGGPPPGGEGER